MIWKNNCLGFAPSMDAADFCSESRFVFGEILVVFESGKAADVRI